MVDVGVDIIDPSKRCVFVLGRVMLWASEERAEPRQQRRSGVASSEELEAIADEMLEVVMVFVTGSIEADCF